MLKSKHKPAVGDLVYSRRTGRKMEILDYERYGKIDCIILRPAPGDPEHKDWKKHNRRVGWSMDMITKDGFQRTLF